MTLLQQFENEIQSVAAYAKRINFNIETGDFDTLMRNWIEDGRKREVAFGNKRNREQAMKIVKRYL